ncbi:tyramine oxidase subunit B [Vibrio vulnificus]|uniref:tyramine oxidase subunit B n=1 Tax=Vibrio vulnificus TaxID=672 RepID=UPI001A220589|nr:tyramine oxidase subunit B [Vibrio vulnificus]MDK2603293.1 tyramine oxidase subunit B [Vibrio vulnificus]MDK2625213.1 tyramine oxidase subunit B [Vibrio vulnificus]MDK2720074.1 tyramine oxidase subunit B [Vibrio vulnificus]MDK2723112.1 tyramine oxidase subunit B [Vibrio vulnificus]HAS8513968.1 ornithine cyclodeaminase [Vibrio vulnificus]
MSSNTKIDFIYLSEPDMIRAGVTDMTACVDTMEEMFALLHQGDYRMAGPNNDSHGAMITFPEESPISTMPKPTADRRLMAMPAYLGGDFGTCGVKWYGSNIANREKDLPRSILMFILNDIETSAPLAIMSANLLSAYRTGAIPGVGARYLARKDSKVIGLLGPGVMGKTSVAAFMAACPNIDTIKIKGRGKKSLDSFLTWVSATFPQITNVEVVESVEDVVCGSDIVTYCNSGETGDPSLYPEVKREWVKPGAFLAMPASCRLDAGMEQGDVRKVLDNTGLYQAWYEEVPKPAHNIIPLVGVRFMDMIEEGKLTIDDLEDLGSIVAGETPKRQSEDEIIILSVGGMPVEDVAWATKIYRNAVEKGIGVNLNLWNQPELK